MKSRREQPQAPRSAHVPRTTPVLALTNLNIHFYTRIGPGGFLGDGKKGWQVNFSHWNRPTESFPAGNGFTEKS